MYTFNPIPHALTNYFMTNSNIMIDGFGSIKYKYKYKQLLILGEDGKREEMKVNKSFTLLMFLYI